MNIRPLSLLLALALIVSLSVTVLATGEQPSGSNYSYWSGTSLAKSDFWSALTLSAYNLGREFHNTFSGSYSTVSSSGTTSTNSSFWTATANSLANIGFMLKYNTFNVDTEWTPSNISSVQNDVSSIRSSNSNIENDVDSIRQDVSQIADFDLSTIEQNTTTTATNSTSLIDRLGIPPSGSTFWSNALATKENTASLVSRTFGLSSNYKFVNSSGVESSGTSNWWLAMNSSLLNSGTISIALQRHIDSDFHSLHDKIGNPIDIGSTLFSLLTDLHTVFASPEDLEMHENNQDNYAQANDDFLSGQDSSSSIGVGTLGSIKGIADNAGNFFKIDSSISPTFIFSVLDQGNDGSVGPWMWFSRSTLNDLDRVQSTRKSVPEGQEIVDFLTPHEKEFQDMLGADKR